MASRLSTLVPVRMPNELVVAIDAIVAWSQDGRQDVPFTRSSLVVKAVRDFLAHRERSRRPSGRARKGKAT